MPTTVTCTVRLDPSNPPKVNIHQSGIATYVTTPDLAVTLEVPHWRSEYEPGDWSPEAFAAWLRAAADAIDAAWTARRLAEQHEPLKVEA